jgi:hypothetical protein
VRWRAGGSRAQPRVMQDGQLSCVLQWRERLACSRVDAGRLRVSTGRLKLEEAELEVL